MYDVLSHVVGLSGGKDSTAMSLRLKETEPDTEFTFVCTPTGDELPEMLAHWDKLEELLGQDILRLTNNGETLNSLIEKQKALPNWRMRWCTRILKIEPFNAFLMDHLPAVSYVGLRADEDGREGADYGESVTRRFPLREWGWGLKEVWDYLDEKGIEIPKRTDCGRCFFQRLGEWRELLIQNPEIYANAEAQEKAIGATFRSPRRDKWPTSLENLREEFETGRLPRGYKLGQDDREMDCRVCSM